VAHPLSIAHATIFSSISIDLHTKFPTTIEPAFALGEAPQLHPPQLTQTTTTLAIMASAAQRPTDGEVFDLIPSSPSSSDGEGLGQVHTLERQKTNETITHPGDVRINVKGAFIVDAASPLGTPPPNEDFDVDGETYQHDPKGIRLPHHKAVVSHIAVDVREMPFFTSSTTYGNNAIECQRSKEEITNRADEV